MGDKKGDIGCIEPDFYLTDELTISSDVDDPWTIKHEESGLSGNWTIRADESGYIPGIGQCIVRDPTDDGGRWISNGDLLCKIHNEIRENNRLLKEILNEIRSL